MDMACFLLFLLIALFNHACAKLQFMPFRHEVRLHYNAPPDFFVARVRAVNVARPNAEILYGLHEVHNYKYFRIENTTGNIYTKDYVFLRIGNNLTIMVVAYDQDEAVIKQIQIRITEYNRQRPVFEYDIYRTEISFVEELNVTLLTVQANDNDSISYNSELYYTLKPGNWTEYFQIDLKTGELKLKHKLNVNIKKVRLDVLVEDGGSPKRNNTAVVEITIKTITEPRKVRQMNPLSHSVDICWDRPAVGNVTGYLIRFRETRASQYDVQDLNVTTKNMTRLGSGFCTKLKGLKPWMDYQYRVYALNNEEIGLGSEVHTFATRSNHCLHNPCRNGRCLPSISNPGFVCDCNEGYYGTTCNHFNPCINNPCSEYGECRNISDNKYNCSCSVGYSGFNCSVFDPCLAQPAPCANGATCLRTNANGYNCLCPYGYYGSSCKSFNSCVSNPCKNGGSCLNATKSTFNCSCPLGFTGKYCEIDIDECKSTPCANGANCIDKPNGFRCLCLPGFVGELCNKIAYCPEGRTETQHGVFYWPKSLVNETRKALCPYGPYDRIHEAQLFALRSCLFLNGIASWSSVNASKCGIEGFNIAMNVTTQLSRLTSSPQTLNSSQISTAANQIVNVYNYALHDRKIAGGMLSVISNMLDIDEDTLDKVNDSEEVTDRLIDMVKNYTLSVALDQGKFIQFRSENLVIEAINWNNESSISGRLFKKSNSKGIRFFGNRKHFQKNETEISSFQAVDEVPEYKREEEFESGSDEVAAILVPDEVLDLANQQNNEGVRLQFISFKNAKFFRGKNKSQSFPNDPWQPVIIADIANAVISNLTRPVVYKIPTSPDKKYVCAYWDQKEKKWSQDGIMTNQSGNFTTCYSSHMTAFSVLFDPDPNFHIDKEHEFALSIVSYVGCALSIIGLVFTIITYSIFRCLNRDRSGKILLCLCIAMLLMNVSFVLGSQSFTFQFLDLCVAVAILTHYFLLTTLAWMCVEAINMYHMLINVFASSETHFMLKRSVAAWGIPFIIVAITAGIDVGYYKSKNEYCILSPENPYVYYFTFLGPSCIILLVNCIVFILVTRVLFQPRLTAQVGRKERNVTIAQVRGAFTVMTLLGITWVFGALAVGPAKVPFTYIFCVLNSLQGFIIFVVRCIQYPEAQWAWEQLLRTGTLKKYRGAANLGASTNSQYNGKTNNDHSATQRTLSAGTTVTTLEKDKDRKLSIASLTQFFRDGIQRRQSNTSNKKTKDEENNKRNIQDERGNEEFAKEENEIQCNSYCSSVEDLNKVTKSNAPSNLLATNGLGANEQPLIEDEHLLPAFTEHTIDQGYSSLENSPNCSRILAEPTNTEAAWKMPNQINEKDKGISEQGLTNSIHSPSHNNCEDQCNESLHNIIVSQHKDIEKNERRIPENSQSDSVTTSLVADDVNAITVYV